MAKDRNDQPRSKYDEAGSAWAGEAERQRRIIESRTKHYPTPLAEALTLVISQHGEERVRQALAHVVGMEIQLQARREVPGRPYGRSEEHNRLVAKLWDERDPDHVIRGEWR